VRQASGETLIDGSIAAFHRVVGFFKSPQSAAALEHGILQRCVVVFPSKTGSMSGAEVISSTDMPGRYETGDPDVAECRPSGIGPHRPTRPLSELPRL
jgi:hypothetical protein